MYVCMCVCVYIYIYILGPVLSSDMRASMERFFDSLFDTFISKA